MFARRCGHAWHTTSLVSVNTIMESLFHCLFLLFLFFFTYMDLRFILSTLLWRVCEPGHLEHLP